MPTRIADSLGGGFDTVDGEAVHTVAGFLRSWSTGAAVGHRGILTRTMSVAARSPLLGMGFSQRINGNLYNLIHGVDRTFDFTGFLGASMSAVYSSERT
jgi:hypothetical protein